ncbi:4253_t:CDS:2 [Paraglomus occultum]|uniref:4253_t:CDS:1 n=1 Tax=Paraglomus occultum TaxID=144539 RepID=A0A9N9CHL6_9GLOM|nr:4253_t:CDS:2 [Paraglomus occultum]
MRLSLRRVKKTNERKKEKLAEKEKLIEKGKAIIKNVGKATAKDIIDNFVLHCGSLRDHYLSGEEIFEILKERDEEILKKKERAIHEEKDELEKLREIHDEET